MALASRIEEVKAASRLSEEQERLQAEKQARERRLKREDDKLQKKL